MTAAERWPYLDVTIVMLRNIAAERAADTLSEMAAHIDAQDAQIRELTAELAKPVAGAWRRTGPLSYRPTTDFGSIYVDDDGWIVRRADHALIGRGPETGPEAEGLADAAAVLAGWRLT